MTALKIKAGPFSFDAKLERDAAPQTCAAFETLMTLGNLVLWEGAQEIVFSYA